MSDALTNASRSAQALGHAAVEAGRAGVDRFRSPHLPLPLDARRLTPAVLASVVGTHPVWINDVEVVSSDRGSADRATIAVGSDPRAGLPPTLFLKLTPSTYVVRLWSALGRLAEKEVHFYRDAAPALGPVVPHCYGAALDPRTGRSLVVLENLAERGVRFPDVTTATTPEEAHAVAETLGTIHRTFWAKSGPGIELSWFRSQRNPWTHMEGQLIRALLRRYPGRYNAAVPDDVRRASRVLVERPGVVFAQLKSLPRTLIHNDSHPGNMYFDNGSAGIFDWQVAGYGPVVHDIGYFIVLALDPELRRKHERGILRTYLDALGPLDGSVGWDEAWRAYRAVAATAFTSSVYTASFGDRLQAEAVVIASLEHTVAAVEDLETFELLAASP